MENKIKSQSSWKTSPNFTSMSQCRQRHNSVSGLSSQDKIANNTRLSTYKTPPITFTVITAQKKSVRKQKLHDNNCAARMATTRSSSARPLSPPSMCFVHCLGEPAVMPQRRSWPHLGPGSMQLIGIGFHACTWCWHPCSIIGIGASNYRRRGGD